MHDRMWPTIAETMRGESRDDANKTNDTPAWTPVTVVLLFVVVVLTQTIRVRQMSNWLFLFLQVDQA